MDQRRRNLSACRILACAALLLLIPVHIMLGRPSGDGTVRLSNASWKVEKSVAVIEYSLDGQADEDYGVSIVLLDAHKPEFRFVPKSLTGDIGKVRADGRRKSIRWEFMRVLAPIPSGEAFFFEITAERTAAFPWLYAAAGGVAVGVVAAILLIKPSSEEEEKELPMPPPLP